MPDADAERAEIAERWDRAAAGWERRADQVLSFGMPVSAWMIDRLRLQPGQCVLELAAGPGDTGFMAAELIRPGGTLICSDASERMLEVARRRAAAIGLANVEFKRLELEWIDQETASTDAIVCRWGLMFAVDQEAAVREMRRVLRPGGRVALSVWAGPDLNPWATIPTRALVELGHTEPPDPAAPGMFVLADGDRLRSLLEGGGFLESEVAEVEVGRKVAGMKEYLEETIDLSAPFAATVEHLTEAEMTAVTERISELVAPFGGPDGSFEFPGCALTAAASA